MAPDEGPCMACVARIVGLHAGGVGKRTRVFERVNAEANAWKTWPML